MNEYEIAASERGQFQMLTQVERVERVLEHILGRIHFDSFSSMAPV